MQNNFIYSKHHRAYLMAFLVFSFSLMSFSSAAKIDVQKIEFDIYLNDKKVGQQSVNIMLTDSGENVVIESQFNIKLLFVNVFSYQHTANEVWRDSCLHSIDTRTKENSDEFFVQSKKIDDGLSIIGNIGTQDIQGCVRSFAYWDLQRLGSDRLLNGQTAKYVPAKLIANGEEEFLVKDKVITASRYTLTAEGSDINLWYDKDKNWVGLSTLVKGGRTLSYTLR